VGQTGVVQSQGDYSEGVRKKKEKPVNRRESCTGLPFCRGITGKHISAGTGRPNGGQKTARGPSQPKNLRAQAASWYGKDVGVKPTTQRNSTTSHQNARLKPKLAALRGKRGKSKKILTQQVVVLGGGGGGGRRAKTEGA